MLDYLELKHGNFVKLVPTYLIYKNVDNYAHNTHILLMYVIILLHIIP